MTVDASEKALRAWLTGVNPVVDVALSEAGALTFANAAERAGVATPAQAYVVRWARFDNATGAATNLGEAAETSATTATAPASVVTDARVGTFVQVAIGVRHPDHRCGPRP